MQFFLYSKCKLVSIIYSVPMTMMCFCYIVVLCIMWPITIRCPVNHYNLLGTICMKGVAKSIPLQTGFKNHSCCSSLVGSIKPEEPRLLCYLIHSRWKKSSCLFKSELNKRLVRIWTQHADNWYATSTSTQSIWKLREKKGYLLHCPDLILLRNNPQ